MLMGQDGSVADTAEGSSERVSFSRDLAPIVAAKCLACHSSEKAKGGYRMHTFAAAMVAGKSKQVPIQVGEPEKSELFLRLTSKDEDERMPQKDDPLPPAQVELFRRWIVEGASLDRGATSSPIGLLLPVAPHPAPPVAYPRAVPILALAWNSTGTELAVGGYHEILVASPEGAVLRRVTNVVERVHAVDWAESNRVLVAVGGSPGRSGEASLYDAATGERRTVLVQATDVLLCLALDPAGRKAAAGGADNAIHIIDLERGEEVRSIQQHADWVQGLDFSADGSKLASASRDRTARVYDVATGELEATYVSHAGPVFGVAFVGTNRVATAGRDRSVHLWKTTDGKKDQEIGGFDAGLLKLSVHENQLLSASGAQLIEHKIDDQSLVRKLSADGPVFSFARNPVSDVIAAGSALGTITLWNAVDGGSVGSFRVAPLRVAGAGAKGK